MILGVTASPPARGRGDGADISDIYPLKTCLYPPNLNIYFHLKYSTCR